MRLKLDLPPDAEETRSGVSFVVVLPQDPSVQIQIGPLEPMPLDIGEWLRDALTGDVDPDRVRVLGSEDMHTREGWQCRIVDVAVINDAVVEHRLVGLYDLLGHVAAVKVRVSDEENYPTKRQSLLSLLLTARPSWRSRTVVAISELWDLDTTRPND